MNKLQSLADARLDGRPTYKGNPCRKCRGTERKTASGHCVVCFKAAHRDFYRSDKGKLAKRSDSYRRRYGVSAEQVELLLLAQNGVCAICKTSRPDHSTWHVDHDHKTGVVRGVLCRACNTGLGAFRDDADSLRAAIDYLTGDAQPAKVWLVLELEWLSERTGVK